MMSSKFIFRALLLTLLPGMVLLWRCSPSSLDTGGSSGTEISMVSGTVLDADGNPVANAVVRLRPATFLADSAADETYVATHSLLDTVSGNDGSFEFSGLEPDAYVVEISIDDSLGVITDLRIDTNHRTIDLDTLVATPMAQYYGNVQIDYGFGDTVKVQVYGIDRSVVTDNFGNFAISVPSGSHTLHIGAYASDTAHNREIDWFNLEFYVDDGEKRNTGNLHLHPQPPPPCTDGMCDSFTVRSILDRNNYKNLPVDSVTVSENGRIVELHLRGFDLSSGGVFEVNRLSALRLLDLGETRLQGMFPDIGRMSDLETVKLDGNFMTTFPSNITPLIQLRVLDLHANRLTNLSPSITACTALEFINISYNRLCYIDASIIVWLDEKAPGWRETQQCK